MPNQSDIDNRADQLNPNNDAYYQSRGGDDDFVTPNNHVFHGKWCGACGWKYDCDEESEC